MSAQKIQGSNNERGFAVVLGLFILLIVSIAGMSLLSLAQKDKSAAVDSSTIRNVALAADAALKACESQFSSQPDVIVAILNKYVNDETYKWLLVSDASGADEEKKISFGSDGLMYSACITAYDAANQVVQIKGVGHGRRSEQKSISGIYKLNGIMQGSSGFSKYGLYLAGPGRNFDQKVVITGDVYIGTDFHFNNGSDNSVIHGSLKTGKNTALQSEFDASGVIIDSAAYIGTGLKVNGSGPVTFRSKTGIEGKLDLDNIVYIKKAAWINGVNGGNSKIVMSFDTIHHSGLVQMSRVKDGVEDKIGSLIPDIANKVGLGSSNDSAWKMDVSSLTGKAKKVLGAIGAGELQVMFDNCSSSDKVNGYMILTNGGSSLDIRSSFNEFKGKVIWIFGGAVDVSINGNWFNMSPDSRMLIYARDQAKLTGFGFKAGMSFNGLIFLTDESSIKLSWIGKNSYFGAIHLASGNTKWQCNSSTQGMGTELDITYDQSVLLPFKTMGILTFPSSGGTASGTVVLSDLEIRPQLVAKVN